MGGDRATGGMASRAVKTEHEGQHQEPVPEKVAGTVFPYRGVENHGVAPNQEPPAYNDDQWPEDTEEPHYVPGPTEEDPHPVKIVQESRSEEHTSELQSLMRISYPVVSLKQKKSNSQKKN